MNGVVKQLSVFVNNEPGALSETARMLKECNVDIKAFCISESIGFGVLRAIVHDPEQKAKELKAKGLVVKVTDVLAIEMDTKPGSLYKEAEMLSKAGLNIEYAYAYNSETKPILFVKVDDIDKAVKMLKDAGAKLE